MATKSAGPVDSHIGARIRSRRIAIGMSQERLGDSLGVTFQQVQKYEKGANRVGASRLQAIADALNVPAAFFFDGQPAVSGSRNISSEIESFLTSKEGTELARAFLGIKSPAMRRALIDLARTAASVSAPEP
jgi:transcriptional regulator with XRE-family HTH domain